MTGADGAAGDGGRTFGPDGYGARGSLRGRALRSVEARAEGRVHSLRLADGAFAGVSSRAVRVVVVALDPILEAGVASALWSCPGVRLVVGGEPAEVAVVVSDEVDGEVLDLLAETGQGDGAPRMLLVATDLAPGTALRAVEAGVCGLLKRQEAARDRLSLAVRAVADGTCTVPLDLLDALLEQAEVSGQGAPEVSAGPVPVLSDRERTVLRMAADGHDAVEIGHELAYSVRTVTGITHNVAQRLSLRNRAQVVAFALRAGLI